MTITGMRGRCYDLQRFFTTRAVKLTHQHVKELIAIKKDNAVKNFNEHMTLFFLTTY